MLKKTGIAIAYAVVIGLLLEGTGHVAYRISQGQWFDLSAVKDQRTALLEQFSQRDKTLAAQFDEGVDRSGGWQVEIVHPYIGYVIDYNDDACGTLGFCDERIRAHQATWPDRHFAPDTEQNLIVAITGGSFANGVANGSTPGKWESELAKIPAFADKNIVVYSFASGGIKQPQQLNTIGFFLGMGASFDAIINIDGFNEIALPATENVTRGIYPFFPRYWSRRVGVSKVDPAISRLEGEHAYYEQEQETLARSFSTRWYRNSALANLLWIIANDRHQQRITDAEQRAQNYDPHTGKFVARLEASGPRLLTKDDLQILKDSSAFWASASRSMQGIADAHGIPYFHFLQPNQYLEGSKPMGAEERAVAIERDYPYGRAATAGYPLLVEDGRKLKRSGVNFFDLTDIYAGNDEVLYRDACCHVNQRGYDYIVDAIVETIEKQIERFQ